MPQDHDPLEHSLASVQLKGSSRIGPYDVLSLLGSGSFGIVYWVSKVPDETLALKLLIAGDEEDAQRFSREIELARRLEHPGLVRIVDAGRHQQFPYYVMEYCPGETLTQRLKRGRLEPTEAAELVLQLARTVAAVNGEGVIHRDLKPSNVILDEAARRPRITDFGLAHDARAERLTRTGDMLGTPTYMAPEQFQDAKRADQRADVYALGAILYECLTGAPPFSGPDLPTVAKAIIAGRFAPPSSRCFVPRRLEEACLKAMARIPEDRYPTAHVLVEELEEFLAEPEEAAPPAPSRAAVVLVGLILLAGVLAVAVAVVLLLKSQDPPAAPTPSLASAAPPAPRPAPEPTPTPAPSSPAPAASPAPTAPTAAARTEARAALVEAQAQDRRLAPRRQVLALYRRARELAAGDPALEGQARRGELDVLWALGHRRDLREGLQEGMAHPATARYAKLLWARTLTGGHPQRRAELEALAADRSDGVGLVAAALLKAEAERQFDTALLRRAVERDPSLTGARAFLGAMLAQQGQAERAIRVLAEAVERDPDDPHLLWTLTTVLQKARRSKAAIGPLERLIAIRDPGAEDLPDALYQRARMALHVGKLREGLPYLDRMLRLRPTHMVGLMLRAMLRLRLGQRAEAAADYRAAALCGTLQRFQRALERRYRDPRLQAQIWDLTLGALRGAPPPPSPAAKSLIAARAAVAPDAARADLRRALTLGAAGRPWSELGPVWARVVEAAPDSGPVGLLRVEALLDRDRTPEALQVLDRIKGAAFTPAQKRTLIHLSARLTRKDRRLEQAARLWRRLHQRHPGHPLGVLAKVQLDHVVAKPDPRGMLEALQRAAERAPDHVPTLSLLATLHASKGDPFVAIAAAERVFALGACSLEVLGSRYLGLARLLIARQRWDWARAEAERLLRCEPRSQGLRTTVQAVFRKAPRAEDRAWAAGLGE